MKKILLLALIFIFLGNFSFVAQVKSQWRGKNRDGKYNNEKLLKKWPAKGPKLIASINNLGDGYSQPAVTSNRIYVTGMTNKTGYLFAFNLSGKQIWKKNYGKEWERSYPGARGTPTVAGNKIYLVSGFGKVVCFNKNGKKLWSVDMIKKFNAPNIRWGITESPLVNGDLLYCTPGAKDASIVLLNRHTGKTIKKIKINGQTSTYCSPRIIDHNGRKIVVTMLAKSLVGFDLKTNKVLFQAEHETRYDINPNTPLYHNGYIYSVSGYGTGGQLFKLNKNGTKLTKVWEDEELDSQMGAAIIVDGYIYGSGHKNRNWKCIDFKTGKMQYESRKLGRKGNIVYSDGMLYLYSEKGDVALVKPNSEKFEIVSSFRLREGTGEHWAHPVIKKGRLYVRHGDDLNIYNIAR